MYCIRSTFMVTAGPAHSLSCILAFMMLIQDNLCCYWFNKSSVIQVVEGLSELCLHALACAFSVAPVCLLWTSWHTPCNIPLPPPSRPSHSLSLGALLFDVKYEGETVKEGCIYLFPPLEGHIVMFGLLVGRERERNLMKSHFRSDQKTYFYSRSGRCINVFWADIWGLPWLGFWTPGLSWNLHLIPVKHHWAPNTRTTRLVGS